MSSLTVTDALRASAEAVATAEAEVGCDGCEAREATSSKGLKPRLLGAWSLTSCGYCEIVQNSLSMYIIWKKGRDIT